MRKSSFIMLFAFSFLHTYAQKAVGMQQYYYWQTKTIGTVVPKLYYQSPRNWYTELRYNYEEVQTASVHFGKVFEFKNAPALKLTPVGGVIFGKLNGGSAGAIIEVNLNKFCFSSEPQYVFSFSQKCDNYLYSWTEISYQVLSFLYAGLALQQTKSFDFANILEAGVMTGVSIKKFDIPVYCFNPASSHKNFVVGINWRWEN